MADNGRDHGVVDQQARDLGARVLARQERHEDVCNHLRRSQQQWQESAVRILHDIKEENGRQVSEFNKKFEEHAKADLKFQTDVYAKISGWNKFLINTLISLLGGCFVIIGAFVWHSLFTH